MEQQIRFCTTSDGVRIAYATTGRGIPVVRVLGWFTHLEFEWEVPFWRSFIDSIGLGRTLVRYDGRGTGLSDREIGGYTQDALVADVEAVVDALGLEKFVLYGISQGGPTAITYAVRHPNRVSHLILYGSFAHSPVPEDQLKTMATLARQGWGSDVPAHRQFFTGLFMPDGPTAEDIRIFNEMQRRSATGDVVTAWISVYASEFDVRALLPKIAVPTLVMHRRGDAIVPFELGREIAAAIPNARFLPLEGSNHAIIAAETAIWKQMASAVDEFLGEPDAVSTTPAAPAGLVTILFTDMEGSTSLTQHLGDAKAQELLRVHNQIIRDALTQHGGTEVKHTGDGVMASFPYASRAPDCAAAIQRAIEQRNESSETSLHVRIGLNAGEPVAEESDLFGSAVQLAARVCAHAEPGQILASNVVRELAMGKGFLFADQGDVIPKGFEDPVRLYEVCWRD